MNRHPPTTGVLEKCHHCTHAIGEYEVHAYLGVLGPYHLRCAPFGAGKLYQPDTPVNRLPEEEA